ncbi:MAG: GNAT family N-acetyltransferase [Hyphomonadaceae bacterium]
MQDNRRLSIPSLARADVVRPLDLSAADIAAWRTLQAAHDPLISPYLTPEWAQLVARHRPDARVVVFRDRDRAVGFLPVQLAPGSAALPAGGPICDYQAIVGPADRKFDLSAAARALGVGRIDFTYGLKDSAVGDRLFTSEKAYVTRFADGWQAWRAERKSAGTRIVSRTEKNIRRLTRDRGGQVTLEAFSTDAAAFEQMITWKRAQYAKSGVWDIFERDWIDGLIRESFAMERTPDFGGAFFVLRHDGKMIAGLYCLQTADRLHAWFTSYDPHYAEYTPGVAVFLETIRTASEAGFKELDLGVGAMRYKESLANRYREVGSGFSGRPGLATVRRAAEFGVRNLVEVLPLGPARQWPGKAMRRLDIAAGMIVPEMREKRAA